MTCIHPSSSSFACYKNKGRQTRGQKKAQRWKAVLLKSCELVIFLVCRWIHFVFLWEKQWCVSSFMRFTRADLVPGPGSSYGAEISFSCAVSWAGIRHAMVLRVDFDRWLPFHYPYCLSVILRHSILLFSGVSVFKITAKYIIKIISHERYIWYQSCFFV